MNEVQIIKMVVLRLYERKAHSISVSGTNRNVSRTKFDLLF